MTYEDMVRAGLVARQQPLGDWEGTPITREEEKDEVEALRAENARLRDLLRDIHDNAFPGKALGARITVALIRGQPVDNALNTLESLRNTRP